jgi:hypothetical protein
MEQSETTNSTPTKRILTFMAEMTAVTLLQELLYRQRDELAAERAAVKARADEVKALREEEAMNFRNLLSDLKFRDGSYYTGPFACLLACFSDAVRAI